jgi:hypothetical protein
MFKTSALTIQNSPKLLAFQALFNLLMYGGVDVWIRIFLTSALVGGEWSRSRPGRFTPNKEPCTHSIGDRSGRYEVNILGPSRDSNSEFSVIQTVASRYID